jgi:nitronate monooxygenase
LGAVPEPSDPFPRLDEERLQMMLDLRPPVVSFHFGLPPADTMKRIKQSGAVVLSSATTVAEARKLEAAGADAIIAQGFEAGGHRGTFTEGDGAGLIGTMALVPQVVDAVSVPVIAAGGIADGRGIAAASPWERVAYRWVPRFLDVQKQRSQKSTEALCMVPQTKIPAGWGQKLT